MLFNHLSLCHPLLLLPSIFSSIRVFANELALHIRWPKYWRFRFSISPSNEYSGLISFRMTGLISLMCSQLWPNPWGASNTELGFRVTCLLRNLYVGQEATFRTRHGTADWFQIGKGVRHGCILSPSYLTYMQSTSLEMVGWMKHKLESRLSG